MTSTTLWISLTIIGLALFAVTNVMDKILRTRHLKSNMGMLMVSMMRLGVIVIFIPFVQFQAMKPFDIFLLIIAGILWEVLIYVYIAALSFEEVSRVIPLWSLSPLFTFVLASIFLGERLSGMDYIAFTLLVIGSLLVSTHIQQFKKIRLSKAFYLMLLAVFLIVVHFVILKYLFRSYNLWMVFFFVNLIGFLMALTLLPFKKPRTALAHSVAFLSKEGIILLVMQTVFSFLAYFVYNYAVLYGPLILISSLDGFQSLFIFIFTIALSKFFPRILKENISLPVLTQKAIALGFLFAGLWLLSA